METKPPDRPQPPQRPAPAMGAQAGIRADIAAAKAAAAGTGFDPRGAGAAW